MMDKSAGIEQKLFCVTLESLMPKEHFLRELDKLIDFSFIYDKVKHLYSHTGRRSIDPVVIVKMLLLGYLYGIDSERRLEQEIQVNIAYRWFLGIDLDGSVPDHSTLSQLRRRKFNGTSLFEDIFTEVVFICIKKGLVDGKLLLTDSTHIKANTRNDAFEQVTVNIEPSQYLNGLNEQAKIDGIYPQNDENKALKLTAAGKAEEKVIKKSVSDPDAGFMKRPGKPLGFCYLSHETCDGKYGLITDVFVTPGSANDAAVHSERIKRQIEKYNFNPEAVCADKGYDSSEIHYDMLSRGIKTFIPKKNTRRTPENIFCSDDFSYEVETDSLICPNGSKLSFMSYSPRTGCKRYACSAAACSACLLRAKCISGKSKYRTVERVYHKLAMDIQHLNDNTPEFKAAMLKRKIFCEGNFSHQKARHNLSRMRMRGLTKAFEQCFLSAVALNLKKMVRLLKDSLKSEYFHFAIRMAA